MSAPTFSTVDISSNNSIKTNYAGADDTVSINITASASINQPYVVFQSGGAAITNSPSYSGSAAQWTASYTVSSSDTDGVVSFTIDASNANGSVQTTSTTNSTSVTKVGTTTVTTTYPQTIRGSLIEGETPSDYFGNAVAVNSDGTVIAVSIYNSVYNGVSGAGAIRIYQYNSSDNSWNQLGSQINPVTGENDLFGFSVALNSDTSSKIVFAGAATFDDDGGTDSGSVFIYEYNSSSNSWDQLGSQINGPSGGKLGINSGGKGISLSSDGNRIAFGAPEYSNNKGQVEVWEYNSSSNSWGRLGNEIIPTVNSNVFGYSVALNSDGSKVAIGSTKTDVNASNSGSIHVYEYTSGDWSLISTQINGTVGSEELGFSISINDNGNIVAASSITINNNTGHTKVYQYSSSDNSWNMLGSTIQGDVYGEKFGHAISLNGDGTIIAIGAPYNNDTGNANSGTTRVYQYSSSDNSWNLVGSQINGLATNNGQSGWSVALSNNGAYVILGERGVSSYTGIARIFGSGATVVLSSTDDVPPDLTSLSISSNSGGSIAGPTQDVTITMAYDMSINTPIIDISSGGAAIADTTITYANVNSSNLNWTATYTVDSNDTSGNVTFSIDASSVTTATNATQVTQADITDGTSMVIDTTDPYLITIDLSSNNSIKTNYAGADDVVSLNITASESINQPYVVFQSGGAAITNSPSYSGSGTQWTASYTVSSSDTNGAVSFTIDVSDNVGNNGTQRTTTTNSTSVTKVGTTTVTTTTSTQDIIGSIIEGEASSDRSGYSVSLNSDGTIVAIGAYKNDGNGSDSGHVRVYQYDATKTTAVIDQSSNTFGPTGWNRLGGDIDGELSSDQSGRSVSLSSDGTIVAIGAHSNDGNGSNSGHVRVYQYDASKTSADVNPSSATFGPIGWNRLGADIDGEAESDFSGRSVSLSSDGTIVAIGADGNDGNGGNSGHVRVYQYDATKTTADTNQSSSTFGPIGWNRLGADIDGEAATDYSGYSVALNSDTSSNIIVAIGAYANDGNGSDSGHVRVYQYDASKNYLDTDQSSNTFGPIGWNRLGEDIDGELASDQSGLSVSLSSDGTIVAIGALLNDANGSASGHVRVYQYDASKTSAVTDQNSNTFGPIGWNRLGEDIDGELANDQSGYSVSLNSDGTIVAIGARYNDGNGGNSGHVRVYQYDATKTTADTNQSSSTFGPIGWNRLGEDIDGETASVYFGSSVALNSDGTIVAGGAYNYNSSTGYTGIYNTGVPQTNTSTYIHVPPDLTSLSISSDYTVTTQAKATNEVTLTFAYDMSVNTPIVDISSGGAAIADTTITYATVNDSSLNWTAAYTVDSADTVGAVTFTIDASSVQTFTDATQATQADITDGTSMTILENIDPTISSTTLDSFNSNITVTFSESVYANTNGTGDLTTSDFTISVSGGQATSPTLTAISKTSQSIWDLSLSYTGAANGSEQITLNPASTSIYDANANLASTSQSNNTFNLNDIPVISSVVVNKDTGALNTNVTVTFTESVYNTNGGSGDLELSDFTAALSGGVATTPVLSSLTKTSQSVWDMSLSYTGEPAGTETLTINPVSNSIFNASGVEVRNPQSNNTSQLYERWITTDSANYFKNSYVKGFVDVSGSTIRTRGPTDHLLIAGDSSLNNDVTLSSSGMGIGIGDHNNAVDVSGNVDLSGNLFVTGDVSLNDALYVNALSVTGTASYVSTTLNSTNITYNSEVKTTAQVTINESDMSHNNTSQTIHGDLNSSGTFSSDVNLNPAMKLPGNILVVENPNGDYNYGAYTIYSDAYNSKYFAVGKSASHVFNIVNENNAGVYMDNGSTSFTGTSDARLKKNIEPLEDSTDKIDKLNPCTFQWKTQEDDDKRHLGFIAQEVEEVLPELVDENTLLDGSSYKGVKMDDMIPYLLQYVKKLRQKVNSMKKGDNVSVSTNGGTVTPFNSESSLDKLDKN